MKCRKCGRDFKGEGTVCKTCKTQQAQKKTKKKSGPNVGLMALCLMVFVVAVAIAGFFLWTMWREDRLNEYRDKLKAFESTYQQYGIETEEKDFQNLIDECRAAISDKNLTELAALSQSIDSALRQIDRLNNSREDLKMLKDDYMSSFSLYKVTDAYEDQYNETIEALDDAITNYTSSKHTDIVKRLEALNNSLNADNRREVQVLKNAINITGTSKADAEELEQIDKLSKQVDDLIEEGNYKEAIDKLNEWLELVTEISEKVIETDNNGLDSIEDYTEDYIFEDSNRRKLDDYDLDGLGSYGLMLAANEIYARHGCKFSNQEIQDYFEAKDWYEGKVEYNEFDTSILNEYEMDNLNFLQNYERPTETEE